MLLVTGWLSDAGQLVEVDAVHVMTAWKSRWCCSTLMQVRACPVGAL